MIVFVRYVDRCREAHYKPVWECKTGNVITHSCISVDKALQLHGEKLARMGKQIREIIYRED